ncbi:MAG TPA: potassium transporter TrkG [Leptospiraceae bacterium]|nr:potassium transporter TrkG [Leptospiraceae bacterium]HMY67081.1 potassium transporter TrkG [Leptospiraceae bacterium]HNF23184.1 potassium transporter TrkG [Leptospiraceae bacterium]HNI98647.1 potassium transporter TrkG [Leptospiraceae bacterium]HNM01966.1 potassium transporter TrkG [Leptospiraceae bacterium]
MFGRKTQVQIRKLLIYLLDLKFRIRQYFHPKISSPARLMIAMFGFISIGTLTLEFGFNYPELWDTNIKAVNESIILTFIIYEIFSFIFTGEKYSYYVKTHKPELLITSAVILQRVFHSTFVSYFELFDIGTEKAALSFVAISQVFFAASNLVSFLRTRRIYNFKKLNPSLMFFLSFAAIIIFGTALLSLPKAHTAEIPLIDIFFTVISATCVTGLSTIDISVSLSFTGQIILMFLIQIGGLGLITLTSFFSIYLAGQASVNDKLLMKDILSEETLGRVAKLVKDITMQTAIIESAGAAMLYIHFPDNTKYSFFERIFISVFHSVSAFCNAGFSLFSRNLGEDFIMYEKKFLMVIMILIVLGGIGFPVIAQVWTKFMTEEGRTMKLNTSSRLAITVSFIFILFGGISYFFLEKQNTLSGLDFDDSLFQAFFYSVSTRTAGFNTLDMAKLGMPMTFLSLFLMWVGASPNSTGGGIKTTAFAISLMQIFDFVRGKDRVEIFRKEIHPSSLYRASATIVLSLFVIFSAIFLMLIFDPKLSFLDICFEAVSAFGTVGLSKGITSNLSTASKSVLCFVMFAGRVGILTILIALLPKRKSLKYSYIKEYVVI